MPHFLMLVLLVAAVGDAPGGKIQGIVRDAQSGAPVEGALVTLQTKLDDGEEHRRVSTGTDGVFTFAGIEHGRQTVRIIPARHLEPEPLVFSLSGEAPLREIEVRLESGRTLPVTVINGAHDPATNVKVLAVTESKLRSRTTTDAEGRASVAVPPGETVTLFVIPRQGPFGVLRVPRDQSQGRVKVYLPGTSSSLLIRALTLTGGTMPPFALLMRYNGELVPPEVAEELTAVQGLQLMTGAGSEALLENIPSGSYEFWPYRTDDEAASLVASADALNAPIHVNVRVGENKIAVKFAPKGRR